MRRPFDSYTITSKFGEPRPGIDQNPDSLLNRHNGEDYVARDKNEPIKACEAGRCIFAGLDYAWKFNAQGRLIKVPSYGIIIEGSWRIDYWEMQPNLLVKTGQMIREGQSLGLMTDCLHLEFLRKIGVFTSITKAELAGLAVDPEIVFNAEPMVDNLEIAKNVFIGIAQRWPLDNPDNDEVAKLRELVKTLPPYTAAQQIAVNPDLEDLKRKVAGLQQDVTDLKKEIRDTLDAKNNELADLEKKKDQELADYKTSTEKVEAGIALELTETRQRVIDAQKENELKGQALERATKQAQLDETSMGQLKEDIIAGDTKIRQMSVKIGELETTIKELQTKKWSLSPTFVLLQIILKRIKDFLGAKFSQLPKPQIKINFPQLDLKNKIKNFLQRFKRG